MSDRTQADAHTQRVRRQFTRQAQAYAGTGQARDRDAMSRLAGILKPGDADDALDVACGPGRLTMAFAQRCRSATGVDATPALLDIARAEAEALGLDNVRFMEGDVYRLDFADDTFPIVSSRAAVHHFADPAAALAEMARVAAPHARVLVADILASENAAHAARHNEIERLCDPTHARALPRSEFEALLDACGLRIERLIEARMSYDVDEWLTHGGPPEAAAAQAKRLLAASIERDSTGLSVERDAAGRLRFTHNTGVFVLRKPA